MLVRVKRTVYGFELVMQGVPLFVRYVDPLGTVLVHVWEETGYSTQNHLDMDLPFYIPATMLPRAVAIAALQAEMRNRYIPGELVDEREREVTPYITYHRGLNLLVIRENAPPWLFSLLYQSEKSCAA